MKSLLIRANGTFFYFLARGIIDLLNVVWWRTEIIGSHNLPKEGPFILAPVHRSNLDGPLMASITRRRLRFLAKGELFKYKTLGDLFISMGAISVNRDVPDRKSLNLCMSDLEAGYPLVLFPEGGRRDGPTVIELQEGAGYLALRAKVPVIPVGIAGSEESNPRKTFFIRPVKIRIVIGEPVVFAPAEGTRVTRAAITEATDTLRTRLQELFDEACSGRVRKTLRQKVRQARH